MTQVEKGEGLVKMPPNNVSYKKLTVWEKMWKQRQLILMSVPFLILCIIFSYVPLWGWLMAFQDYVPGKGILDQTWVGFKTFNDLFNTGGDFKNVLINTIAMSTINLVLGFVTSITLALLLNEIKAVFFKRTVQTISYLPHFLSWVIAAGIISVSLSPSDGIVNIVLTHLHIIRKPIAFLGQGNMFWGIIGVSNIWKEVGWGTIIYLASIASIDPALYEAADIDGANRYQKMWYVTLPGIRATITILLIMSVGHILDAGFEAQYLLQNPSNYDWAQTIDLYVLKWGMKMQNFSLATAAGVFKSVVGLILLFIANFIAKMFGQERLL
jgi:putative aldouronate transport system permease protein